MLDAGVREVLNTQRARATGFAVQRSVVSPDVPAEKGGRVKTTSPTFTEHLGFVHEQQQGHRSEL